MTTTATCTQVAVTDTDATKALADVGECAGSGRRKRSIDDSPVAERGDPENISPSSTTASRQTKADTQPGEFQFVYLVGKSFKICSIAKAIDCERTDENSRPLEADLQSAASSFARQLPIVPIRKLVKVEVSKQTVQMSIPNQGYIRQKSIPVSLDLSPRALAEYLPRR